MGLRFRKSIKIAPGVKLNIGSKSVGVSLGGKFAGISLNSRTGAQVRASAPGTGLSYTKKIGGKKKSSASGRKPEREEIAEREAPVGRSTSQRLAARARAEEEARAAREMAAAEPEETAVVDWKEDFVEDSVEEPLEEIQWQEEFPEE